MRNEVDSLGTVVVDSERLWGAQTQRSLENFQIGTHPVPIAVIKALITIKRVAAELNMERGALEPALGDAIVATCDELQTGDHMREFPLSIWQTGSGTHTNMNVNEVIANHANERFCGARGSNTPVHPNDHVNLAQSSNDVFPSAVYVAGARQLLQDVLPSARALAAVFRRHEKDWSELGKVGRTHLMDATPMTFGQEVGAWAAQLDDAATDIERAGDRLSELALGATAIGTGLNAPADWGQRMTEGLSVLIGIPFRQAPNKFAAISSHDGLLFVVGAYARLAAVLTKIGNDVRLLASGPRCGIGELSLPANEPGSSIMPGKVNPSQAEALLMVCAKVAGNHATAYIAASSGLLQLNVAKPLLALCLLESGQLLSDSMTSFRLRCAEGMKANVDTARKHLSQTLMVATALSPEIGYEAAAKLAQLAAVNHLPLRDVVATSGILSVERFDEIMTATFGDLLSSSLGP